ncbi:alanine racemase [Lentisalinibacter orientalis]|uniref:alanine racemase n=1 Tax=Lentisalinibacter orientalis TaxID=2992241 RepID=UPI00386966FE
MRATACARVHTGALRHNLAELKRRAPDYRVMAVIKSNGYGHGLVAAATALDAADAFAVARMEEALRLREAGIDKPLVLLEGVFDTHDLTLARAQRLELVVHSGEQVGLLSGASPELPLTVWLKVDTGMHRLGIDPAQVPEAVRALRASPAVAELRLMTHFAQAERLEDGMTPAQIRSLQAAADGFDGAVTLANSAAILGWKPDLDAVAADHPGFGPAWIRPGICLYGISPFADETGAELGLEPAMEFLSTLIAVKPVAAGERIGYGGRYRAERDMRLGIAAVGYGDGYPWCMPDGAPVLVAGRRAPIAGRVSMDMITVDLSDLPEAVVGDEVTLWGRGLPVEEVARYAGTIPYELVCRVTERVIKVTE